jgi:lipopolysaccharide/colanic/teichoic acid biosynthesis glycosyltransferase
MALPALFRNARPRTFRARLSRKGALLDVHEFRYEASRERVRADRSQLPLAILIIDLPAGRSSRRDIARLARILRRRLRITDTAGDLGRGRVGVLLPDTPKAGAWKVASDICDLYPVGRERPNCAVFAYPDERHSPVGRHTQHEEQPADTAGAPAESFFSQPTPIVKRAMDVLGASVLAVFAVLIKVTSPGPVFFSQWREGHGGRRFRMYKLRSMCVDADQHQAALRAQSEQDGPAFKMRRDPRTTWIGRLLRATSLDELPQLWNVLMGDMSLVGPRPLPCAPWQRRRLAVLPGLTCVWQVRGRSTVSFVSWMRMDLEYVRRRSLSYDVRLLLATIPSVLFQRGPR